VPDHELNVTVITYNDDPIQRYALDNSV